MPKTILIIDDEPHLALTLSRILRRVGYETVEASSADEGLAILESQPIDLIFLDLCMPRRSGIDILPDIRRLCPNTPVLILTADGSVQKAIKSLQAGATEYLLKPVDPGQIITKVDDILNQNCEEEEHALSKQVSALEEDNCLFTNRERGDGQVYSVGNLTLDFEKCQVILPDRVIGLTPCSMEYLYTLARHAPQTVSYSALVTESQGYQLSDVEAQDLARWRIYRLRKLIEANLNEPKLILSDPGTGYRLALKRPPE